MRWPLVVALSMTPGIAGAQVMAGWKPVHPQLPTVITPTPAPEKPSQDDGWQIVTMTPGRRGETRPVSPTPKVPRQQPGPAVDCNMPVIAGDTRIDPKFAKPVEAKDAMTVVAPSCGPKKK